MLVDYESHFIKMYHRLYDAGAEVEAYVVENAPHEGAFWGKEVYDVILRFLDRHMKKLINVPLRINGVSIKNRLVMPPMSTAKCDDNGFITDKICEYYDEKTKGGYIGLVITEYSYISQQGKACKGQISVSKDEDIEGLSRLAETVHKNGSKIFAQINHAGSGTGEPITGMKGVAPSVVLHPFLASVPGAENFLPEELSVQEIKDIVAAFAEAALRVKKAGFDGVEIHAAHGYLLSQFYSPLMNKRTDEYGGSLENRIRIHKEILCAVRKAVGEAYPVAVRFGACDFTEGGSTVEEGVEASLELEKAGADLLDITAGMSGWQVLNKKEPGYFKIMTEKIKEKVSVPVLLTGGITDKETAETLLEEKKADLIGVGRAILKNSGWAAENMKE